MTSRVVRRGWCAAARVRGGIAISSLEHVERLFIVLSALFPYPTCRLLHGRAGDADWRTNLLALCSVGGGKLR